MNGTELLGAPRQDSEQLFKNCEEPYEGICILSNCDEPHQRILMNYQELQEAPRQAFYELLRHTRSPTK